VLLGLTLRHGEESGEEEPETRSNGEEF